MPRNRAKNTDQVDWNAFINQPGPEVRIKYDGSTENAMKRTENLFREFTSVLKPPNFHYWIENITLRVIEGFLRWYLDNHNVVRQSGFLVFARFLRMVWCRESDKLFPYLLRRKMTALVCTTLTDEYELDLEGKTQPPVNIDDLLYNTHHLMTVSGVKFATVRCRQQHSTLRKMMTSTSARPGTLVLSAGYMKRPDSLKWKDIELYMVKHPEFPGCRTLLMKVTHRLNKGKRNKGVPPQYIYTERNDNLALCVIQDVLEYAFRDGAFASEHIQKPRDVWLYTEVPTHRLSTPIHFKESMQEIPVFRRAVQGSGGEWVTHPSEPLLYKKVQEDEVAVSKSAGSKKPGSLYKYRKGAAANLRHLDEHSRNKIMGHSKSGTFAYYVQVQDDTQSAFMETPTRDSLIKLATNSGLTRDPSVPQRLSDERKEEIEKDAELCELKHRRDTLRADLIKRHRRLHKGRGTDLYVEFEDIKKKIKSKRRKLHKDAEDEQHSRFFDNIGNQIIKGNYEGQPVTFEPDMSHVLPERKALADLEFKNRDVDKISDDELLEDRIQSLEMRLALYDLEVPKKLQKRINFNEPPSLKTEDNPITLESKKGKKRLICPICLGRSDLHPRAKQYEYARKDVLKTHFKTHRLREEFPRGHTCDYPGCDIVLYTLPRYKSHQNDEHNILLS